MKTIFAFTFISLLVLPFYVHGLSCQVGQSSTTTSTLGTNSTNNLQLLECPVIPGFEFSCKRLEFEGTVSTSVPGVSGSGGLVTLVTCK